MSYGFENDTFYIDIEPCTRSVQNPRIEFNNRAKQISEISKDIILAYSGGTDSQATYRAFHDIGIKVKCAFMHMPQYNDNEYANVLEQQKKYGFELIKIDIDPYLQKGEILNTANKLDYQPNHVMHSLFLKELPTDHLHVQCFNGPDFVVKNKKHYLLESGRSMEYQRLRAFAELCPEHTVIGFEKESHILCSILKDPAVQGLLYSWPYFDDRNLEVIEYWDQFCKPIVYGNHWKHDIDYYVKCQGCENIDYIIDGPKHRYRENQILIEINSLVDFLDNGTAVKRFYQRD